MGMFLNSLVPYEQFQDIAKTRFFVDKSAMIGEIISGVTVDRQRYLCVTRPRCFGKSVMANMIGAFFGKAQDAADIFAGLEIMRCDGCH